MVFTWQIDTVLDNIAQGEFGIRNHVVGGPAVKLMPEKFEGVAKMCGTMRRVLARHNQMATFTTRGCIRNCKFCAVPKTEGSLVELSGWEPKPIVCDNNLLAASRKHFDRVIDSLRGLPFVDFNQGLDARLFTAHHAERIAELKKPMVRFACDNQKEKQAVADAVSLARDKGLKHFGVYVLFGFYDEDSGRGDTPDETLDRLEFIHKELGIRPNPMRFQPLDSMRYDEYISPNWDREILLDYRKYWSSLRYFEVLPFKEFKRKQRHFVPKSQTNIFVTKP